MSPPNRPLWYIDYFEPKALEKHQMQGEAFSELSLSTQDRSSKRNSVVIDPPAGSFLHQGGLSLITGEETRS